MDTIITWMGDRLLGWITNKSDLRQRAITGLTPAIYSTILYTDEEEKLYRLWYEASSQVVDFDRELAKRCLDKSEYWLHSELYSPEKVGELNISLVGMKATLEGIKHN